MLKSVSIIFLSFLTAAAIVWGVWYFFFSGRGSQEGETPVSVEEFLSFGKAGQKTGGGGSPSPSASTPQEPSASSASKNGLVLLSAAPVAGFTVVGTSTPSVRYIERATGHIFDIPAGGGTPTRITNTTIPRLYEAFFADGGATVILRYLRDDNATIETYAAAIPSGTGGELKGTFLPENIDDLSVSPDGKRIFYLLRSTNGATGFLASPSGGGRTQIWSSAVSEWLSSWTNPQALTLTTKASGGVAGFAYALNPSTKAFDKIAGGAGLTALAAPAGNPVLLSSSEESGDPNLFSYDTRTGTTAPLDVATLSEKCAWSRGNKTAYCGVPAIVPSGKYPDSWYQGTVLFADRIWELVPDEGRAFISVDLRKESGKNIDAIRLALSPDQKTLVFINKKDQSLWAYRLGD